MIQGQLCRNSGCNFATKLTLMIGKMLMRSTSGAARNFKRGKGLNFYIFFKRIFFSRTNLKLIEKQERF